MESKLVNYQPLSHSRRSKFEECPRAFAFTYLEKIPQLDNIYASVGTFIHAVIEDFYNDSKNINPRNYEGTSPLKHFEDTFNQRYEQDGEKLEELFSKSDVNNSFKTLQIWLETLMKNYISIEEFIHNPKTKEDEKFKFLTNFEFWPGEDEVDLSNSNLTMERKFDVEVESEGKEVSVTGFIDQLIEVNINEGTDDNSRNITQTSIFEQERDEENINNSPRITIVDIKTSKPPKNIKSYEDQLNTYAMFVEKEVLNINKNAQVYAGLFFLGGTEEDVSKRILPLDELAVQEIENKFKDSNKKINEVYTADIKNFETSIGEQNVWKEQTNNLCNWCWYKNLCPTWLQKKNTNIEMAQLNQKLFEVRHSGGVEYGYERNIKAELIGTINQIDLDIVSSLKEAILKSKSLETQFDFFIKENELDDPLFNLKNEIKTFLAKLRNQDFSNELVSFIKDSFIQFSSEKKDQKVMESWEIITKFFNDLKAESFQNELRNNNLYDDLQELLTIGRNEWNNRGTELTLREEVLSNIKEIKEYLAIFKDIKKSNIQYKVKLYDTSFLDLFNNQSDEINSLSKWLENIEESLNNLYEKTKELKRVNLNRSVLEFLELIKKLNKNFLIQAKEINKLLKIL